MSNQLTYREKFTSEMVFGGVPCDTEWVRNSNLFQEGLKKFDSGEWKYYEKEVWKGVPEAENKYEVSNHGNLRAIDRYVYNTFTKKENVLKKAQPIKKIVNEKGYYFVQIYIKKNVRKKTGMHRLVAMAFIPNPLGKEFVNHINGNKQDNHVSNLEWCTPKENVRHAYETGLIITKYGHESSRAKLTREDILGIREMFSKGCKTKEIAALYKMSPISIRQIKRGKTYKHTI